MSRRKIREHLLCMLFRKEFYKNQELKEQFFMYLERIETLPEDMDPEDQNSIEKPDPQEEAYMEDKLSAILSRMEEIDETLKKASSGWQLNRMGRIDLAILRLAVYEMNYDGDVPIKVAINEAVELAKKYGGNQSPAFVNGVLAKLAPAE